MLIKTEDIQGVLERLLEVMNYADRFMYMNGEYITPDKLMYPTMRLCKGYEDQQIFYAGQPEPNLYNPVSINALYEILTSIQKGTIYPHEYIAHDGMALKGVINLGAMIK